MPSKPPAAFGKTLRSLRESKGLTQAEVAERADISVEAYGRIERGRVAAPRGTTLTALARVLNVTTDQLLGVQPKAGHLVREQVAGFGDSGSTADLRRVMRRLQKLPPKAVRLLGMFLAALEK